MISTIDTGASCATPAPEAGQVRTGAHGRERVLLLAATLTMFRVQRASRDETPYATAEQVICRWPHDVTTALERLVLRAAGAVDLSTPKASHEIRDRVLHGLVVTRAQAYTTVRDAVGELGWAHLPEDLREALLPPPTEREILGRTLRQEVVDRYLGGRSTVRWNDLGPTQQDAWCGAAEDFARVVRERDADAARLRAERDDWRCRAEEAEHNGAHTARALAAANTATEKATLTSMRFLDALAEVEAHRDQLDRDLALALGTLVPLVGAVRRWCRSTPGTDRLATEANLERFAATLPDLDVVPASSTPPKVP